MDGTYEVFADTPLGRKSGKLTLSTTAGALDARLKVAGFGEFSASGTCAGQTFSLEGSTRVMLVGKIGYRIDGIVEDGRLEAVCKTSKGDIVVTGQRV